MKVNTKKSAEREVVVLDLVVSLVQSSVGCCDKRDCMLCNCVRRICRYAADSDAALFSCLKVNIVEACAAEKDQLDTALFKCLNSCSRALVINEDADSVITLGKVCGFRCEAYSEILDIAVVCAFALVFCQLAEEDAVIVFCSEERDLNDFNFLLLCEFISEDLLDCLDSSIFIAALSRDLKNCALLCIQSKDLENVIAVGNLIVSLDGDCRSKVYAALCKECSRTSMDTK